ncbi:hypothetical protein [Methermicoccus shengliensis]|uniref:hypothetical protein n=1 Tax=Methermicoccus shengliensis TaxID=660064 RepID=UPI0023F3CFB9
MRRCGLVYDERYLLHDTGNHPESPLRLSHTMEHLGASGLLDRLELVEPAYVPMESVLSVHTLDYIERLRGLVEQGIPLDADTPSHLSRWMLRCLRLEECSSGLWGRSRAQRCSPS